MPPPGVSHAIHTPGAAPLYVPNQSVLILANMPVIEPPKAPVGDGKGKKGGKDAKKDPKKDGKKGEEEKVAPKKEDPLALLKKKLTTPEGELQVAKASAIVAGAHVIRRSEMLECDKLKFRLAQTGVSVPRGTLEKALVAPNVSFTPEERLEFFPMPFTSLASNPFAAEDKAAKKGGKKGKKK